MLSNYVKMKIAAVDYQLGRLALSHIDEELRIDSIPMAYKIRKVVLNHCGLASLRGIQQFQNLEELTIKFNDIRQVSELHRISNKGKIHKLDFSGNDIEYLGAALFINLHPSFQNLEELNGKNYLQAIKNKKSKDHSMKTILNRVKKAQKQMAKIMPKGRELVQEGKKSEVFVKSRLMSYLPKVQDHVQDQEEEVYQREQQQQSRYSSQRQEDYSLSRSKGAGPSRSGLGLRENPNYTNIQHNDKDISLGAISSIPMTKSIAALQPHNKKGLQILTVNESSQNNHQALLQPTATFAMQRKKENMDPHNFVFKNKQKNRYQNSQMPIEEYLLNSKEYERPTKRRSSESDEDSQIEQYYEQGSDFLEKIMPDPQKQKEKLANVLYIKNLQERILGVWRKSICQAQKWNLPMKLSFE